MSVLQNYSLKPIAKLNKLNKGGEAPIYIRLIIDRKPTEKSTPYKVLPQHWDEATGKVTGGANFQLLNAAIQNFINQITTDILKQNVNGKTVTGKILKTRNPTQSFKAYATEVRGDSRHSNTVINRVINFHGRDPMLSEIDAAFLRKFKKHEEDRGQESTTINTTFKFLRVILNQALAEKLIEEQPMNATGFVFPAYIKPETIFLDQPKLAAFLKMLERNLLPRKGSGGSSDTMLSVAVHFLIGCYTGLRHSDWNKAQNFEIYNGNIILRAKKNNRDVVIPMGDTLQKLLDYAKWLPPAPTLEACNRILKTLGIMAGLKEELTTHVGRHTFGCLCASLRIRREVTADIMGISLKTVETYYHLAADAIEEDMRKLRAV